tara:strand:- start:2233 stop:3186 length:954 start_codon:yes stop_codon:yes gene_type:complete
MPIPNTNEARIETSTACNAACVFCPWPTDDFTRKKEIMSLEDYKFYIDKLKDEMVDKIEEVTVSGFGEAFLDKTLLDKMRYAKDKGYGIHVLTNGSLLDEFKIDEMFDIGIMDLRVSLHTTNPDSYGNVLNYKGNRHTLEGVLNNLDYAIERKPNETEIIITADIVEENKNDVDKLVEDYGDKCSLEIWYPHNWIDTYEYRDYSSPLVHETCGRPKTGPIQIQVDGDVIMCCFDFNDEMILGNFRHQTLEEIFSLEEDNLFSKIYNHHEKGTCGESDLLCSNCDQLKLSGEVVIYNNRIEDKDDRVKRVTTNLKDIK